MKKLPNLNRQNLHIEQEKVINSKKYQMKVQKSKFR
jgi:hypothetical protein